MTKTPPTAAEGTWWLGLPRVAFAAEIAKRFAVNRAEPSHGAYRVSQADQQKRSVNGGRAKARNGSAMKLGNEWGTQ